MYSRSKWATIAIVIATVGLVFGPVFVPREIARWYLAAAANSYRRDDQILAKHYLARAVAWDEEVLSGGDYVVAQLGQDDLRAADELLDHLEKTVRDDPRWAGSAVQAAAIFAEKQDFQRAVRALKMAFIDGQPRTAEGLNQLAYFRALAGVELEEALTDIDRAIEIDGKQAAVLDTKAWVLYAMNRNDEALALIGDAIKKMEEELKSANVTIPGPLSDSAAPADKSAEQTKPASPSLANTRESIQAAKVRLGFGVWSLAILRFHRLRILESLNLDGDTHQDRSWLTERGVPIVDELF
jgi:tetratricopeptide (TPR) repeat protein